MKTMGIDLGIRKIALAAWHDDVLVQTEAWESPAGHRANQLADLAMYAMGFAAMWEPDYIFIEDTLVGNNVKYSLQLTEVKGAVLAVLGPMMRLTALKGVIAVNNKTWKKEVLGNGNASKDMVREYLYSRDSAYSVLCGNDQDRFDAAAIGFYGYIVATRAESLHLADA